MEIVAGRARAHGLEVETTHKGPFYVSPDADLVQLASRASAGRKPKTVPYGTDSIWIKDQVDELVVLGPGSIAQAHTVGGVDLHRPAPGVGADLSPHDPRNLRPGDFLIAERRVLRGAACFTRRLGPASFRAPLFFRPLVTLENRRLKRRRSTPPFHVATPGARKDAGPSRRLESRRSIPPFHVATPGAPEGRRSQPATRKSTLHSVAPRRHARRPEGTTVPAGAEDDAAPSRRSTPPLLLDIP